MNKIKSMLCVALLSTLLVGNVFAGDTVGIGAFSIFGNVVSAVASLFGGNDCPPRQCTHCRPDQRDENGDCRPDPS